ncbi:MAG: Gx transporter family protein [Clostridia bacterium]|nr:Gx transporter family protein [Clostridia bacterium]
MKKSAPKFTMKNVNAKRVALSGIMLALALIVALLESMIPPIVPMLPYAKLGLTNVVLLACFLLVGVWEGYLVLVIKCVLSAVYAGNMAMLLWSLPSALVAYTAMVLLHRTKLFSVTGLSVTGGMLHNFTQILVATIVVGKSVFFYLPYMLLAGGVAGLVTGVICHFAVNGLKDKVSFDRNKEEYYSQKDEEDGAEVK